MEIVGIIVVVCVIAYFVSTNKKTGSVEVTTKAANLLLQIKTTMESLF